MRVRAYNRKLVVSEIRSILQTGHDRIIEAGGTCDSVPRMLKDTISRMNRLEEEYRERRKEAAYQKERAEA